MVAKLRGSPLTNRDAEVEILRGCLLDVRHGLRGVPDALKLVINTGAWKERIIVKSRQSCRFERFVDFVTAPPLEGLGADIKTLERLCKDDSEALSMLALAVQGQQGGDHGNQYTGGKRNNVTLATQRGNRDTYALRRLRAQRPDLHRRVLAGELSPHAAMLEAGFRKRTMTVPADVDELAAYLRGRLSSVELARLIALVQ